MYIVCVCVNVYVYERIYAQICNIYMKILLQLKQKIIAKLLISCAFCMAEANSAAQPVYCGEIV